MRKRSMVMKGLKVFQNKYKYLLSLSYSNNLDLLLNMENLKFFIFPDCIASSIHSH